MRPANGKADPTRTSGSVDSAVAANHSDRMPSCRAAIVKCRIQRVAVQNWIYAVAHARGGPEPPWTCRFKADDETSVHPLSQLRREISRGKPLKRSEIAAG